MRKLPIGNDQPIRWAVTVSGKPFNLEGQDVHVYVVNSRGEIPLRSLKVKGAEVSGVFEGRYQTRLGEHSLILRVNEGRPEMKTASVANVFELVKWSADAGGSDEGDVIITPVLLESELSIGGVSYDDTELREAIEDLEHRKVNAETGKGLSTNDFTDDDKKKLLGLLTIEPLSDAEVLKAAFEKHHFADRLNVPILCFIKENSKDEAYQSVILIVEKYPSSGYKLNFINIGATSQFKLYDENGVEIEDVYNQEWQWSPKCKLINGTCDSYLIQSNGYVLHLGKGELVVEDGGNTFLAEYDITSYQQILTAYNDKKLCYCRYGNVFLGSAQFTNGKINFFGFEITFGKVVVRHVTCDPNNIWENYIVTSLTK